MTLNDQIKKIQEWLADRPSASMDPYLDMVLHKRWRLSELKAEKRKQRPPSKMMEAQQMEEDA